MMNNDTETSSSSPTVTTESKESNEAMTNAGEEEQSNDQSLVPAEDENNNNNDDQFIRITAAHQILTEGREKNSEFHRLQRSLLSLSFFQLRPTTNKRITLPPCISIASVLIFCSKN